MAVSIVLVILGILGIVGIAVYLGVVQKIEDSGNGNNLNFHNNILPKDVKHFLGFVDLTLLTPPPSP